MKVAILALQGAFIEHEQRMQELGIETCQIRNLKDWHDFCGGTDSLQDRGLILPGGESTVQMRLLRSLGLFAPLKEAIEGGLAVMGTCAGMILLSEGYLGTMHMSVRRNAYGRQLGSFRTLGTVDGVGDEVPMTFIRAPYVEKLLSPRCKAVARVDGNVTATLEGRQLALAFHPELDEDRRVHEFFLSLVIGGARKD